MKSRLCLRILLLRAYDAINDGADTFFRVLVFAAMKPAYAKASAFADATAAALCAMAVKTADKSALQPVYAKASARRAGRCGRGSGGVGW